MTVQAVGREEVTREPTNRDEGKAAQREEGGGRGAETSCVHALRSTRRKVSGSVDCLTWGVQEP